MATMKTLIKETGIVTDIIGYTFSFGIHFFGNVTLLMPN